MINIDQLRARDVEAEMEQHYAVDEKPVAALSTSASIPRPRPNDSDFPAWVLRFSPPQPLLYLLRVDRIHHFLPFSFPVHSSPPHHFTICAGVPGNSAPLVSVFILFTTGSGVFLIGRRA